LASVSWLLEFLVIIIEKPIVKIKKVIFKALAASVEKALGRAGWP
jgi:hypothetical protein